MKQQGLLRSALIGQELQAIKLFIVLFHSIYFCYEIVYRWLLSNLDNPGLHQLGFDYPLQYLVYILQPILFGTAILLMKLRKTHYIKYVYVLSYLIVALLDESIVTTYYDIELRSGNIVEILLVLFSPIFVNWRFYWTVSIAVVSKYTLMCIISQDLVLLVPILLIVSFAAISYIVMNRFQNYVDAIAGSYKHHLESVVKGIVATLELKDPFTRGHSDRVANYATLLLKQYDKSEINADEIDADMFYWSCLLHDVGKVHIPDHILLKKGKLDDEEYQMIKEHPIVGSQTVKGIVGLEPCLDVIQYHHERWDGKGYPLGLKQEQIPVLARIASIADAFDAMTSLRSYRDAMTLEESYERIVSGSGTQFDPAMVELFQTVYPEWSSMYHSYQTTSHTTYSVMDVVSAGVEEVRRDEDS